VRERCIDLHIIHISGGRGPPGPFPHSLRAHVFSNLKGRPCQGRGSEAAPAHRDEEDAGREQCVIALSPGAFDVWPGSHTLSSKKPACENGHYHVTDDLRTTLQASFRRCVFSSTPGDVLVFKGGHFWHGSPAIGGGDPSPRIVTYASFWPPSTNKGMDHAAGKCGRPHCAMPPSAKSVDGAKRKRP
jgi:hypothetical protein